MRGISIDTAGGSCSSPHGDKSHYANNARTPFFSKCDVTLAGEDNLDPKLHLAITSDRVVTTTSNLKNSGLDRDLNPGPLAP